ncbi:hypothetical protein EON83_19470 [bacterium]|nr:MAG: hypothetical protein EON83_19470 [bacterium]
MKSLPFKSHSHLGRALAYTFETGTVERHLEVFRWDDRLVAYEEASGLWWCTLDARGQRDVREFWQECVENERVGRLYSVERAFHRSSVAGVKMTLGAYPLYVVVAHDNSGMARIHEESVWHDFPAGEVWGIRKPLAARPTIWSKRFQGKFGLRGVETIGAALEEEVLRRAPESIQSIWEQGTSALPIRLIMAAFSLGWGKNLRGDKTPYAFWKVVLQERFKVAESLPTELLQSPEVALRGQIAMPSSSYYAEMISSTSLAWREPKVILWLVFRISSDSAHELIEHRLVLRDWLSQFFSPDEVGRLFSEGGDVK